MISFKALASFSRYWDNAKNHPDIELDVGPVHSPSNGRLTFNAKDPLYHSPSIPLFRYSITGRVKERIHYPILPLSQFSITGRMN